MVEPAIPTILDGANAPRPVSARILVADDEESMRHFVKKGLTRLGHQVEVVETGLAAIERLGERKFDVIVSDLRMPGASGMEVLEQVRLRSPDTQVILMTAFGTIADAVAAIRKGAFDYVTKPFEFDEMAVVVERALELRGLRRENETLRALAEVRDGYAGLVGQSPAMRAIFDKIERLRESDATVLVLGESGTGKEMVARALAATSRRSQGPFVAIACGAIPETLIDSELFGHLQGAFTGATKRRHGLLEKAHGGTLFLDELLDLSWAAQSKLERALATGQVVPLGGTDPVNVDFRVIASSQHDLDSALAEGRIRPELFYRLAVVRIELPPLRARREDIPLLVERFLESIAQRTGQPRKQISFPAMIALSRPQWLGNVRELQNLIERLCALHPNQSALDTGDLPDDLRESSAERPRSPSSPAWQLDHAAALADFEREYFSQLLRSVHGNVTEAASRAGISRGHLHRRCRQLGIHTDEFRD
ncbi:MAG: sigma-54-dependent transcriptional regulator [Planctomycetota bacterium]